MGKLLPAADFSRWTLDTTTRWFSRRSTPLRPRTTRWCSFKGRSSLRSLRRPQPTGMSSWSPREPASTRVSKLPQARRSPVTLARSISLHFHSYMHLAAEDILGLVPVLFLNGEHVLASILQNVPYCWISDKEAVANLFWKWARELQSVFNEARGWGLGVRCLFLALPLRRTRGFDRCYVQSLVDRGLFEHPLILLIEESRCKVGLFDSVACATFLPWSLGTNGFWMISHALPNKHPPPCASTPNSLRIPSSWYCVPGLGMSGRLTAVGDPCSGAADSGLY